MSLKNGAVLSPKEMLIQQANDDSGYSEQQSITGSDVLDKPAQTNASFSKPSPRYASGVMVTPAEQVLYGEPMHAGDYKEQVQRLEFDVTAEYSKPETCISFGGLPLLTLGNFSVVSGKAKSGKSGFVAALAALVINPTASGLGNDSLRGELHDKGVILFDTEQGEYHLSLMGRKIHYLAGMKTEKLKLKVFKLRGENSHSRLQFIDATIKDKAESHPFVIIDGIRDVVLDINSTEEATHVANWLLNTTMEQKVHICTVLHENKSNDSIRGHLGTELQNKTETVFTVEKDAAAAVVYTPTSRHKGMKRLGMDFEEREGGLWMPRLFDDARVDTLGRNATVIQRKEETTLTDEQIKRIAINIWQKNPLEEISPSDLKNNVATIGQRLTHRELSQRKSGQIVATMQFELELIEGNGKQTKTKKFVPTAKLITLINAKELPDNTQIGTGI